MPRVSRFAALLHRVSLATKTASERLILNAIDALESV
jgi:hypothetical protein